MEKYLKKVHQKYSLLNFLTFIRMLYFSKILLVLLHVEFDRIFLHVLSSPLGYMLISRFVRKIYEYINSSVTP